MVNNLTLEEAIEATFHRFPRNESYVVPGFYDINSADATFAIAMCLMIFQMQTGFALVEAGIVRSKNSINIMMKNIADVCIGGLAWWVFGFGLAFGRGFWSTPFFGAGDFFVDMKFGDALAAPVITLFFYQMSYATTSNTIVSGAIAERASFPAYCLLTFIMTLPYSIGAGWVWGEHGFLRNLGVVDLSGGVIHIVGGAAGVACAWFIGPRIGRYDKGKETLPMGNPMNACVGMFILWWGWLAFNAGCAYGITGGKWAYAARGGCGTALATWGAGAFSIIYSMVRNKGRVDIYEVVTGILCALIMINSSCFLMPNFICVITGAMAAFFSITMIPWMDKIGIDDPIGVYCIHWFGGIWGYLTVGLFAEDPVPLSTTSGRSGLIMGGGFWLFSIQCIAIVSLTLLGFFGGLLIMWICNKIMPIRLDPESEEKGCDLVEHGVYDVNNSYAPYPPPSIDDMKPSNVKFDNVARLSIPNNYDSFVSNSGSFRMRSNFVFDRSDSVRSSPKLTPRV
ncbi:hypothetical protein PVAND_003302 [Polypedilum vanderplanki]|uniref:Ammonium transporter AmtB-like domain-containing protein n=1 Tax=Polypedilum vanderplanki TaxID=319348 RepID=A0A9J6BTM2_POLVA|nr:hypothetical protein PVAND_003302 [Polypedilum vanderplanki]